MKLQPTKKQVDIAYLNLHVCAAELIAKLEQQIKDMPNPGFADEPVDWAHVGTVQHVVDTLRDLTDSLD